MIVRQTSGRRRQHRPAMLDPAPLGHSQEQLAHARIFDVALRPVDEQLMHVMRRQRARKGVNISASFTHACGPFGSDAPVSAQRLRLPMGPLQGRTHPSRSARKMTGGQRRPPPPWSNRGATRAPGIDQSSRPSPMRRPASRISRAPSRMPRAPSSMPLAASSSSSCVTAWPRARSRAITCSR